MTASQKREDCMGPSISKIPVDDATVTQILDFLRVSNLEDIPPEMHNDRAALIELMKNAKLGRDGIFVVEGGEASSASTTGGEIDFPEDFKEEEERWGAIRIGVDRYGENKFSSVFVRVNDDKCYFPRGRVIVTRERFILHLHLAVENRREQDAASDGSISQHFSDAKRVPTERFTLRLIRWCGYVKDGPPKNVPDGAELFRAEGSAVRAR